MPLTTQERIVEIVTREMGVDADEVTPNASFQDDLGADSLDVVEMIMAIEDAFGIDIPDEEGMEIATVGQAIAYVESKIPKKV